MSEHTFVKGQPVQIRTGTGLHARPVVGTVTSIANRRIPLPITVQWGNDPNDWCGYHPDELEPYEPAWNVGDLVRVVPSPVPESVCAHVARVGSVGTVEDDDSFDSCTRVAFGPGEIIHNRVLDEGETRSQYVLDSELELVSAAEQRYYEDDEGEPEQDPTIVQLEPPMLDLLAEQTARSIRADLGAGPDDRNPTEWVANLGGAFGNVADCASEWADNLASGEWADNTRVLETLREDLIELAADALEFIAAIDENSQVPQ